MLTFHVLNVGHGSSVVVDFEGPAGRAFGVVDTNAAADQTPRAIGKLRALGAKELAFLCITHPHKDHFSGAFRIIQEFKGRIHQFYSCPMGDFLLKRERLKLFASKLAKLVNITDSETVRRAAYEFLQILKWADEGARTQQFEWHECSGDNFGIAPPGFSSVEISTILPPSKAKGAYVQLIENEDASVLGTQGENEISLALQFTFSGVTVVLGGDGSADNWAARRRYERNKQKGIAASIVNLPHHGSKYDCLPDVLTQLFISTGDRAAVTSANGMSHPHVEVIELLEQKQIKPYCTNLIPACGANAQTLLTLPAIDPQLARWIREVAHNAGQVQPCQGDIEIQIHSDGTFNVVPEFANLCGYRGDYLPLLAS
jgi:beta-lactamase superfamily II metal-dependent hydrolase